MGLFTKKKLLFLGYLCLVVCCGTRGAFAQKQKNVEANKTFGGFFAIQASPVRFLGQGWGVEICPQLGVYMDKIGMFGLGLPFGFSLQGNRPPEKMLGGRVFLRLNMMHLITNKLSKFAIYHLQELEYINLYAKNLNMGIVRIHLNHFSNFYSNVNYNLGLGIMTNLSKGASFFCESAVNLITPRFPKRVYHSIAFIRIGFYYGF